MRIQRIATVDVMLEVSAAISAIKDATNCPARLER